MSEEKEKDEAMEEEEEDESLQALEDFEEKAKHFRNLLERNVYDYNAYMGLCGVLRGAGELDELRSSREEMAAVFPLPPDLWLEWINDEKAAYQDESQELLTQEYRDTMIKIFEKAVRDFVSFDVWLEYVQWSCGSGLPQKAVRDIFERALTAVGLNTGRGALIWDAFRTFESANLAILEQTTPSEDPAIQNQAQLVHRLFRRQLALPLIGMDDTWEEYAQFLATVLPDVEPSGETKHAYLSATKKLEPLMKLEEELEKKDNYKGYSAYVEYELKGGDPARVQGIFERFVTQHPLVPDLWIQYLSWLDSTIRIPDVVLPIYERASRNCMACVDIWVRYFWALERGKQSDEEISRVYQKAATVGFTTAIEGVQLFLNYAYLIRRRVCCSLVPATVSTRPQQPTDVFLQVEEAFESGADKLKEYFEKYWDPEGTYRKAWAYFLARKCGKMEKARTLWKSWMSDGNGPFAGSWLEYVRLEREFGIDEHGVDRCRKLLNQAVNSVIDKPESVCHALLQFEREEGTIDTLDAANTRVETRMEQLEDRKRTTELGFSRDSGNRMERRRGGNQRQEPRRGEKKYEDGRKGRGERYHSKGKGTDRGLKQKEKDSSKREKEDGHKHISPDKEICEKVTESSTDNQKSGKRKAGEGDQERPTPSPANLSFEKDAEGFTMPAAPPPAKKPRHLSGSNLESPESASSKAPIEGGAKQAESSNEGSAVPSSREPAHHSDSGFYGKTKYDRTVFVSNVDYFVSEDLLRTLFAPLGEISDVRLVGKRGKKSKGYGFVEFASPNPMEDALKMDRVPIDGRPMFVSKCENRQNKQDTDIINPNAGFRWGTGLEKNKLFVKDLPRTMTEAELKEIFQPHGTLRSVRIVTYRSGGSKGLAYIEFEDETAAGRALLNVDGRLIQGKKISVAISNPPTRKNNPASGFEPGFQNPSAARYNVSRNPAATHDSETRIGHSSKLQLTPRTLVTPAGGVSTSTSISKTGNANTKLEANGADGATIKGSAQAAKLSNQQFRDMFLKKS